MTEHFFKFDRMAAIEGILYLSNRIDKPTLHDVFKLMYWADKYHLENYGRLIFGDKYIAMRHGPVPSQIYDLTKEIRDGIGLADFDVVKGYEIKPHRDAQKAKFSESEIESFEYSIKNYGSLTFAEKTTRSHDDSFKASDENDMISIDAFTIGMKDRNELLVHLHDPNP